MVDSTPSLDRFPLNLHAAFVEIIIIYNYHTSATSKLLKFSGNLLNSRPAQEKFERSSKLEVEHVRTNLPPLYGSNYCISEP